MFIDALDVAGNGLVGIRVLNVAQNAKHLTGILQENLKRSRKMKNKLNKIILFSIAFIMGLFAGYFGYQYLQRGTITNLDLLIFDTSAIPDDATITKATLSTWDNSQGTYNSTDLSDEAKLKINKAGITKICPAE